MSCQKIEENSEQSSLEKQELNSPWERESEKALEEITCELGFEG